MKYTIEDHILHRDGNPVSFKRTPNVSAGKIIPELVVIHYTGDNGTGGLQWLTQRGSQVSAHLWISKTGVVWQLAEFNRRCWHAGPSEWDGRKDCNSFSIGIENQGLGDEWPEAQIRANIGVLVALHEAYPAIQGIAGHDEIALPPGRKVDPGPRYPWDKVYVGLKEAGIKYE